jgi:hypothetical protein
MFKANPLAAGYSVQGHKIPKCDLAVPDGDIPENNIPGNRNSHKQID